MYGGMGMEVWGVSVRPTVSSSGSEREVSPTTNKLSVAPYRLNPAC